VKSEFRGPVQFFLQDIRREMPDGVFQLVLECPGYREHHPPRFIAVRLDEPQSPPNPFPTEAEDATWKRAASPVSGHDP
jgi:hypothetical protein